MANFPSVVHPLHVPSISELTSILEKALLSNFKNASVKITNCPDLTQEPFFLAAEGLGGNARILDIGGKGNLLPLPKTHKIYDLEGIAKSLSPPAKFFVGAGAGPYKSLKKNSEMVCNMNFGDKENTLSSKVIYIQDDLAKLQESCVSECSLMHNIYASDGSPGQVIEVVATERTGEKNFISCIGEALQTVFLDKPVGLGGVFLLERGSAHVHVMPEFSETPLNSMDDIDNWLRFFDIPSPLVSCGVVISTDPGWDLYLEHFHCFGTKGVGGHFHIDTTPADAVYKAYFNVACELVRIDQP